MAQPAQLAHILASSPYQEYAPHQRRTLSSPGDSPASDARYFPASDSDEANYSYSSPPSSAQSSAHNSYSGHFPSFECYPDASYGYQSSPLTHEPMYHTQQQLPPLPMGHTLPPMANPSFRSQFGGLPPLQAPRASAIPGLSMGGMDRPAPKRSRTAPGVVLSSPTTVVSSQPKKIKEKRPAGKNGEDVWPEEVEIAFFESIRLVPKLGRKKIVVNDKPCGRNELIGDYIRRKTGKIRSRKQVSSHIQVLKNIKQDDHEFMNLVAEPKNGEGEEDFTPDAHVLFFAPQEFAHIFSEPATSPPPPTATSQFLSQPMHSLSSRDGLLSPYCSNNSFFSQGSSSGTSSPVPSSACSTRGVSPYYSLSTPGTEVMTNQVFQLSLQPASPAMVYNNVIPSAGVVAPLPPQYRYEHDSSSAPTPKPSPSKLGHRRAASKNLSVSIPDNTFAQSLLQPGFGAHGVNAGSASNPTTPWPQMLHTPLNPPPAPCMMPDSSQKGRLQQVWARDAADWNKGSPALEGSFEHELAAAVASSRDLQNAAARSSQPLKRSYTETDCSPPKKTKREEGGLVSPYPMQENNLTIIKTENSRSPAASGEAAFFNSMFGAREI